MDRRRRHREELYSSRPWSYTVTCSVNISSLNTLSLLQLTCLTDLAEECRYGDCLKMYKYNLTQLGNSYTQFTYLYEIINILKSHCIYIYAHLPAQVKTLWCVEAGLFNSANVRPRRETIRD